jgi:Helix-hairpin-helix motif
MVKFFENIESSPRLISVDQISTSDAISVSSRNNIDKIANSMRQCGINFSLLTVCLTDEEDRFDLITGLSLLEAAKIADLPRVWVLLLAVKKSDSSIPLDHLLLQKDFNEVVFDSIWVEKFINFLNQAEMSELVKISGVKEKMAERIKSKRPFNSPEDLKKLGKQQPWHWLKSYLQIHNETFNL